MEIDNCFQVHGNAWVQQNSCWDGCYSVLVQRNLSREYYLVTDLVQ